MGTFSSEDENFMRAMKIRPTDYEPEFVESFSPELVWKDRAESAERRERANADLAADTHRRLVASNERYRVERRARHRRDVVIACLLAVCLANAACVFFLITGRVH